MAGVERTAIGNVVPELPRRSAEQPKLLEVLSPSLEYIICAVDLGSTNPKVELWKYNTQTKKVEQIPLNMEWGDYHPRVEKIAGQDIKFLNPQQVHRLLQQVTEDVKEALGQQEIQAHQQIIFSLTGFHHDLCVVHDNQAFVILDDPSPKVELNEHQKTRLKSDQQQQVENSQRSTTLAKMIWFKNNFDTVAEKMFGKNKKINWKDVKFTTLRGLIAQTIHRDQPLFPHSEVPDLGAGLSDADEIIKQLATLEFAVAGNPKLFFAASELLVRYTAIYGDVTITDNPDIAGELAVIEAKIATGEISKQSTICALDSVGKIETAQDAYPEEKPHNANTDFSVSTQRMCGNMQRAWMKKLFLEKDKGSSPEFYKEGDARMRRLVEENRQTPYVYFPTKNSRGILCKIGDDHKLHIVPAKKVGYKMEQEEKENIAIAIAKGVAAGMRAKIEDIRSRNGVDINQPIYFYGGLIEHEQEEGGKDGWRQIFAGMMPAEAKVCRIGLPSGASAAALAAILNLACPKQKDWQESSEGEIAKEVDLQTKLSIQASFSKQVSIESMGTAGTYEDDYQKWLEIKKQLEQQNLIAQEGLELVDLKNNEE